MAFVTRVTEGEILQKAEDEARRLGLGRYLVILRNGEHITTVDNEAGLRAELSRGATYVGVTADAKGGQ